MARPPAAISRPSGIRGRGPTRGITPLEMVDAATSAAIIGRKATPDLTGEQATVSCREEVRHKKTPKRPSADNPTTRSDPPRNRPTRNATRPRRRGDRGRPAARPRALGRGGDGDGGRGRRGP